MNDYAKMDCIDIQIQENEAYLLCCKQCSFQLIPVNYIDAYGKVKRANGQLQNFICTNKHKIKAGTMKLLTPHLVNEPCFFLMYLQKILCSKCEVEVGLYFLTVNDQNKQLLGRHCFYVQAFKIQKHEKTFFAMMDQALMNKSYQVQLYDKQSNIHKFQLKKQNAQLYFPQFNTAFTYLIQKNNKISKDIQIEEQRSKRLTNKVNKNILF